MKFVKVLSASFEVFFKGPNCLYFPQGTPELKIREHIEKQHSGGNWQRSSLVLKEVKVKEKFFQENSVKLICVQRLP